MDKKDAWLLELYEGSGAPPDAESGDAEEAVSLREMKDWMDARAAIRSARPDPETAEAIWEAARHAASSGARKDRPARRLRTGWRAPRRIAGGILATALAAVALVGLFRSEAPAPVSTDSAPAASAGTAIAETVSEAPAPAAEGEPDATAVHGDDAAPAGASPETAISQAAFAEAGALETASAASGQAEDDAPAAPAAIPAWDDPDDVMYLQQRIRRIGEGVADGWETPAVPLEMLPAGSGEGGLVPASERR